MPIPLPFPVTMVGRLSECVLISLRTPAAAVEGLLPRPLRLVTHEARGERWAFWNVVLCRVEKMRPAAVPEGLGVSYHHVAYRLLAQATLADGSVFRGLYFVRSDADDALLGLGGDLLSDFRFHRARISLGLVGNMSSQWMGEVGGSGAAGCRVIAGFPILDRGLWLETGSVFESAGQAGAFLKYTPTGICPDAAGMNLRLAEVERAEADWRECQIGIEEARFGFFKSIGVPEPVVERCVSVAPIEYRWRLGRTVLLAADTSR